jgi:iron complex outermembrane receptor protein
MKFSLLKSMLCVAAAVGIYALTAAGARAQTAENAPGTSPSTDENAIEEIVVTGTMIRGVAPVGSTVTGLSTQEIESTSSNNTQQILTNLPQNSSFNNLAQTLPAAGSLIGQTRVPISQPNLRNLPGCNGSGTGACTLVLIDGHRITPEGIQQQAVDPGVIPPNMIERVEVILDGNSAIYGSDAVGGVINFITKKKFSGVNATAHYGFADNYITYDADITGGQTWDTGSLIFAYTHGYHDPIYGADRDYVKSINWATGVPTGLTCDLSNVTVGFTTYAYPALTPGANNCDLSKFSTIYPSETRNNGFLNFSQEISHNVRFELNGFYTSQVQQASAGPLTGNTTIGPTNPYYEAIPGVPGTPSQGVQFSMGSVYGNHFGTQDTKIQAGQLTPTLIVEWGGWEIRTLFTYGRSITSYDNVSVNPNTLAAAASGTSLSTALNPYNIAATRNTALFGTLYFHDRGQGVNQFTNFRSIADGKLFSLPGGDVHAAIGVEYTNDDFSTYTTNPVSTLPTATYGASQQAQSIFGEAYVPIVGKNNRFLAMDTLELSISGRYDHYPEIGGKFDPKFGLVYGPIDWIKIRGSWGTSFDAPSATDKARALPQLQTIGSFPLVPALAGIFTPAGTFYPPGLNALLLLTGTAPNLKPQSSTNWSIGGDIDPPFVPHLTLSGSYYNIFFKDIIGLPTVAGNQAPLFNNYPELYEYNAAGLTPAQLAPFISQAPLTGPATVAQAAANGQRLIEWIDGRVRNLGSAQLEGLDFSANYAMKTRFGAVDGRFVGNYQLKNETRYAPASPSVNQLYAVGFPNLNYSLTVGTNIDRFRAQVDWDHTSGYRLNPALGVNPSQTHVDAYDAVNLFFRYDFDGPGLAKGLALTLGINNVFDADPPVYKLNGGNGFSPNIRTIGRLVQFGIGKQF